MRKYIKNLVILSTGAILGAAVLGFPALSAANPGTPQDPLVSQSYVDMRINEVLTLLNNATANISAGAQPSESLNQEIIISEVLAAITAFYGDSAASVFEPVFIPAGSIVFGGEGTEIILRSGSATAHVPGLDGIVNATSGVDILHGLQIPANNMLIIPREDGRGVVAVSDIWIMVKGGFIVN